MLFVIPSEVRVKQPEGRKVYASGLPQVSEEDMMVLRPEPEGPGMEEDSEMLTL